MSAAFSLREPLGMVPPTCLQLVDFSDTSLLLELHTLVGSGKLAYSQWRCLRILISPQPLSFEELNTVIIDAEAILNSRPIIPLDATESDKTTSLTAEHFLIGRPLKAPSPVHGDSSTDISHLRHWNLVWRLSNDLWLAWKSRYLQALHARTKWLCLTGTSRLET